MPTILHISDIHRTPGSEVSNTVLLQGLLRDLDRQGLLARGAIDLIIVSGDIVQGVPADEPDAQRKLEEQYAEAEAFLVELVNTLLEGDRNRLILVPGNHDIDWQASATSMQSVPIPPLSDPKAPSERRELLRGMYKPRSTLRWSWRSFEFFRVHDATAYDSRFSQFANFHDRFYKGARPYPLDPAKQYGLFEYPDLALTVLALNSCWLNDHLNYAGQIHPDCIADLGRQLLARGSKRTRVIAVWHHNTAGLPIENNYLDNRCIEHLLDIGVTLGLHGHQHLPDIATERSRIVSSRRMILVGAGSLCAGPDELPSGERRCYNVLRIDATNSRLTVHTRESRSRDPLAPIWSPAPEVADFPLPPLTDPSMSHILASLNAIETLIRHRDYHTALTSLQSLDRNDPFVRRLLLECYQALDKSEDIAALFFPPQNVAEACALLPSLWALRKVDRLRECLALPLVRDSVDPAMRELSKKYTVLLSSGT